MFMEYDYSANVLFVYDYMTILHNSYFISREYYDVDDPALEEIILKNSKDLILKEYGIDLMEFGPIDIVIEWQDFPSEEYKDTDENGD